MIGRKNKQPPVVEQEKPKGFDDYAVRLGDAMRGERATLGKSLLDVQRELKIKAPYIAAIENADPTAFETPGFIAGYVRSYARYLGMDAEWAFTCFCKESEFATAHGMSADASSPNRNETIKVSKKTAASSAPDPFMNPNTPFIPVGQAALSRIEPGALGSSLVLLALIGAIGYGGWSVLQEVQRVQFAPVNQTPGLLADVADFEPSQAVLGADTEVAGFQAPSPDALDRLYRPEALDVPILIPRDGPIASLDPSASDTLPAHTLIGAPERTQTTLVANAAPIAPVAPDDLSPKVLAEDAAEVMLVAVRPTWVRVRAADRSIILEKVLDAGESFALPKTEEPPLLRVGNAGSLYFSVEGQTYGPSGNGPVIANNVELSPDALRAAYQVADLTKDADLAKVVAELAAQ